MNQASLIGITGGIGTGKSSVSRLLAAYCNVELINIDAECKKLLEKGEEGWQALERRFGLRFFTDDGQLDRPLLREAIFTDHRVKKEIDELLHPLARQRMQEIVAQSTDALLFVEIPLLYEAGWQNDVDMVVLVYADVESQCIRIIARDRVSRGQAMASIASQMDVKKKMHLADYVIDNSDDWQITRMDVLTLAHQLESRILSCVDKNA